MFSISCTTCRARLAVRTKEAIGAILECPKCHSMVLITPPEDWEDTEKSANPSPLLAKPQPAKTDKSEGAKRSLSAKASSPKPIAAPPLALAPPILPSAAIPTPQPVEESPAVAKPSTNGHASNGDSAVRAKHVKEDAAEVLAGASAVAASATLPIAPPAEASLLGVSSHASSLTNQPPIPIQRPSEAPSLAFTPADVVEPTGLVARINAIVSGSVLAQAVVLGAAAVLGLALVVGGGLLFSQHRQQQVEASDQGQAIIKTSSDPAKGSSATASSMFRANAARFDAAWIPDESCLIVNFAPSRLDSQPESGKVIAAMGSRWQRTVQSVVQGLGLALGQVQRITWASSDFGAPEMHCVVLIELNQDVDASRITPDGRAVDVGMRDVHFHQASGGLWSLPYALLDPQTIVTGDLASLNALARRSSPHWIGTPLERLAKSSPPDADFTLLVDMTAARRVRWSLPMAFDVWPAGRQAWGVICDRPLALGACVQWGDMRKAAEIALACDGDNAADQTEKIVETFLEVAQKELPQRAADIPASVASGQFTQEAARSYRALIDQIAAAMRSARCKSSDGIARLQSTWSQEGPLATAVTAIESAPAWKSDWRKAARTSDAAQQRILLESLRGYAQAQKPPRYPAGIGSKESLLSPETRLSWMATLLPYYGHEDWHKQLDFTNSWSGPNNRAIAERTLAQAVNPALGEAATAEGYPVTHYVGVAGVGKDAALEPANSLRAGMFGFGRQTRPEELERGAANTIAILGVSGKCGPWAQGGNATARALEHRPYVNGPDGFGSGQPDGMLAGFADGAVRFVSKDCDPVVLEQLAAIRGPSPDNGPMDLAALDPGPKAVGSMRKAESRGQAAPQARQLPPLGQPRFVPPRPVAPPDHALALHLKLPLAKLRLPGMTLGHAVRTVAEIGNLTISYDLDALEEAGASLRDPIDAVDLNDASVDQSLEAVLGSRNLTYQAENKVVLITSPPDNRTMLTVKPYTVSDLTGGNAQAAVDLAAVIARMVAPESWQAGGGPGSIEVAPNLFHIRQTAAVHYRVLLFCEKLRIARGLATKSHQILKPEQLSLATRWQRLQPTLDKPVSAAFREQAPLATIVAELGKAADVDIVIDQASLAVAGMTNLRAKLLVDKLSLERALNGLLKPLGLVWRAVDAHTLEIASTKTLSSRLELEFYNAAEPLAKEPADALVHRLQTALGSAAWAEGDGLGAMIVDAPAKCLIVLQTPAKQMELGMILAGRKP